MRHAAEQPAGPPDHRAAIQNEAKLANLFLELLLGNVRVDHGYKADRGLGQRGAGKLDVEAEMACSRDGKANLMGGWGA